MAHGRVSVLIVGAPRSGTTLVQRLVAELAGVAVPFETHFFTKGIELRSPGQALPLEGRRLRAFADAYCTLPALEGSGLEGREIVGLLGGRAASWLDVFDAVVVAACGEAATYGEKTPAHLFWARKLLAARAELRIVAVVRDPRAVVASRLEVPWGRPRVDVQAYRWLEAYDELVKVQEAFPDRIEVVRYEDVVASPDAARDGLGRFLGIASGADTSHDAPAGARLHLEWETWKRDVGGAITTDRTDRWQEVLDPAQIDLVGVICERALARFGYGDAAPSAAGAELARGSQELLQKLARLTARTDERLQAIEAFDLGPDEARSG